MKKNLSKITLGVVLSSLILIGIVIFTNDTNMELKDIYGDKNALDDVSIIYQEQKGLYSTKQTVISKEGVKVKKFAKELPTSSKYSNGIKENRDFFNQSVDLIYEDKESIGYMEHIYTESHPEAGLSFETTIKNKNLNTNKITEFDINVENPSLKYENTDEINVIAKYKNNVYLAMGITSREEYDRTGKLVKNSESTILVYKVNLETQEVELYDEMKIKDEIEISHSVSFAKNNKIYFMVNTYENTSDNYLIYYDLENNKFDYIKEPIKLKEDTVLDYYDIHYSNDDKLNLIQVDNSSEKNNMLMHKYTVDLETEKIINPDKVYKIDKINDKPRISEFKVIDSKLYVIFSTYKEIGTNNYTQEKQETYNILVLDEKTKKVLYLGQSKQKEDYYSSNYILKKEDL